MDWSIVIILNQYKYTQSASFDRLNNSGDMDYKMDGSSLSERLSYKILDFSFISKLNWSVYIVFIYKTASEEIGTLICSMKFLTSEIVLDLKLPDVQ